MKIGFLIGSPDISGGSFVIFEHALRLKSYGYAIYMIMEKELSTAKSELDWHDRAKALEWTTFDKLTLAQEKLDIVFATWWRTSYELHRVHATKYAYFVQSIESKFYCESEKPLRKLVESTYTAGLPIITEATWIKEYLYDEFENSALLAKNGIRKDIFTIDGSCIEPRDPDKLRVLVEGPLNVPFKNVERTIELCRKSKADEVWLLTSTKVDEIEGVDKLFSKVPVERVADIYRSTDVIVKLSYVEGMFGPPLEMFHCGGTAITYDVTGHDEYIEHDVNALVAKCDDEDQVISYINELKANPEKLQKLKSNAIETANGWINWDQSSEVFGNCVKDILESKTEKISLINKRLAFMYDWYIIAEQYKNCDGTLTQILYRKLKFYLQHKYPSFYAILRKILIK